MSDRISVTEKEAEAIAMAVATGQKSFTVADVQRVIDFVESVRANEALVECILDGSITVDATGKELMFGAVGIPVAK